MEIPHKISAQEAVRLIAGMKVPQPGKEWHRQISKDEMIALARAACKTEGIAWNVTSPA